MRYKLILLFWLLAAGLAAALLLINRGEEQNIKLELPEATAPENKPLSQKVQNVSATSSLLEPRFTGRSVDGRQWDIRAEQATRSGTLQQDNVVLVEVEATVNTAHIEPLTFHALRGQYLSTASSLQLTGEVQVSGYGMTLTSPELSADLNNRKIEAGSPVHLKGSWQGWQGTFAAPRLTLTEPGPLLTLTGGVKGHLTFKEERP